ncbi:MAG: hypothetical protein KC502_19965 [Myxococcales bacterium]|nr:hypothetical protein [Myxococcales bacterium]
MLAGHFAPALVLRRAVPSAPLWALLLATQAVDVAFFCLGFGGLEHASLHDTAPRLVVTSGVWTHGLVTTIGWTIGLGLLARWRWKSRKVAVAIAIAVASHWVADLIVHTPDLPLGLTQEPAVGLGLWLHPVWAWALEMTLVTLGGLYLWRGVSVGRGRLLALIVGFLALQSLSEFVIPNPASFTELGISALAVYAGATAAGWWVDRELH